MSVNPLGELDFELDEYVGNRANAAWRSYAVWTALWTLSIVALLMIAALTGWLILSGEPFWWGFVALVGPSVTGAVAALFGLRARQRWHNARALLPPEQR